jgi:hypothetical protein
MIRWHSFWRLRRLLERQRVGRLGRAKAADRHIKARPSPIGMAFDLGGGGMVLIDRTVSRRSGSLPGTPPKTDGILNMPGRWTSELDLEHTARRGSITPRCYLTFRPRPIVRENDFACEHTSKGFRPLNMTVQMSTRTKRYLRDISTLYSRRITIQSASAYLRRGLH